MKLEPHITCRVVVHIVGVGKANPYRLLYEQHVRFALPRSRIKLERAACGRSKRPCEDVTRCMR